MVTTEPNIHHNEKPPRRRRTLAAGVVALVAVVAAAVVILITGLGGGSPAASASNNASAGYATVQERNLVSTDTESGTLGYSNPQTVYDRLTGTITWLPAVGQVIKPGYTLYDVNGQPVTLFDGSFPAYRDLDSSDSDGPDILQLNRDMVKMGFADGEITVDDVWQEGTTDAVERWQESLGETETGTISFGQIVFLPGAQRVTEVNTTLGSDGSPSSNAGSDGSDASALVPVGRPDFVDYTIPVAGSAAAQPATLASLNSELRAAEAKARKEATCKTSSPSSPTTSSSTTSTTSAAKKKKCATKPKSLQAEELQALIQLLKTETQQLQNGKSPSGGNGGSRSGSSSPSSGSSSPSNSGSSDTGSSDTGSSDTGSGGAAAQEILQTTSSQLVVTVDLDASKQSEAYVGAPVTVEMPNGSTVNGKITAVSSVAQSSSNNNNSGSGNGNGSSSATVPVTVAITSHLPSTQGLDQAAVSVNFEQQVANHVLSVPVTALLATQGGGYDVQEAVAPRKLIPVTVGLFAAGYVQISGPGIYSGLQVTDSQG
jgi:hypothetical protein